MCKNLKEIPVEDIINALIARKDELIYWHDGSCLRVDDSLVHLPREINEREMWIVDAMKKFEKLLVGKQTEFSIDFTNGQKFVGKLMHSKKRKYCAAGNYYAVVHVEGESDPLEGWTGDFAPSQEHPDVIQYIVAMLARKGKKVKRVEIKEFQIEKGGKKWAGVFYSR